MLQPESLYDLSFLSEPRLSPDGRLAAWVVAKIADEPQGEGRPAKKVYRSSVWLSRDGEPGRQVTAGTARDAGPVFSPDGSRLAFTSTRASEKPQAFVMAIGGGEARQLTSLKSGLAGPAEANGMPALAWSPDGRSIAFLSRGDWEDSAPAEGRPRVIERLQYKANGLPGPGVRPEEAAQLWVVDADGGEPRRVTGHPTDVAAFAWLPDGQSLLFVAARDRGEESAIRNQVFRVAVASGTAECLTDWDGSFATIAVSPDGRRVVARATAATATVPGDHHAFGFDLPAGGGTADVRRLDEGFDRYCGNSVNADSHLGRYPDYPVWLDDERFASLYTVGPSGVVCVVKPDGPSESRYEVAGGNVAAFAVGGERTLALVESLDAPLRPVLYEGGRSLELGQGAGGEGHEPERIVLERDGYTVEGWLVRPDGWREGESYPLVHEVHGGPATAYGFGYTHEFRLLASRGFAVLYGNIRGSTGYGERQTRGVHGAYGQGDYDDLMALLDAALERHPWIDSSRLGLIGGSYGGFMTNWVTSHSNRYQAAITDRSICNWLSMSGTSDIGYWFAPRELGGTTPEDFEALWEFSPLKHVANVHTPTLVIHSEEDHRCPIEQGEQWYVALASRGVEARFVRFPGENHELSRSGRPDRRVFRLNEIVDWFERHLRPRG